MKHFCVVFYYKTDSFMLFIGKISKVNEVNFYFLNVHRVLLLKTLHIVLTMDIFMYLTGVADIVFLGPPTPTYGYFIVVWIFDYLQAAILNKYFQPFHLEINSGEGEILHIKNIHNFCLLSKQHKIRQLFAQAVILLL